MTFPYTRISVILLLSLLGFAVNRFKLELFFDVDFIFGSIFVILAAARFGTIPGIATAIVAGSSTWLLWHHPWALVIGVAEAATVGLLMRRRTMSLLAADSFFWFCCGAPLVWFFYHHLMAVPGQSSVLIIIKQSLNGISNAVVAQLILLGIQSLQAKSGQLPRFRQIVFTAMISLVLATGMVALVLDLREIMKRQLQELAENAEHTSRIAVAVVNAAFQQQQRSAMAGSTAVFQDLLKALAGNHCMQITLVDSAGRIVASAGNGIETMSSLTYGGGEKRQIRPDVVQWIPPQTPGINLLQRWRNSVFISERSFGNDPAWKVIVVVSLVELLDTLMEESIFDMSLLLALFLVSALITFMLSRMFLKPLEELQEITEGFSATSGDQPEKQWPVSRVFELDALSADFRKMVVILNDRFNKQQSTYRELIGETEKRQALEVQMKYLRNQIEIDERSRISRDLHDSLGQTLQTAKLNLQIMKARCRLDSGCGSSMIENVIMEISSASEELRDIVTMLRPPVLAGQNLPDALSWLADRLARRSGVDIHVVSRNLPELFPEELKTGLFRICQEALSNALKHGNPAVVEITIACAGNTLSLSIHDNGSGYSPLSANSGSGIGIMKERALLLGGTLEIVSLPDNGTSINVEVALA